MKYVLMIAATLALAAMFFMTGAGAAPNVIYVGHDKVGDALAKGGSLANIPELKMTASGSHRSGPGQVEVHDKETDVFYVTDGDATFVTGGTMVGGKQTKADQWLGSDIQGGETHHLTKGDFMVIPAGTPHWFKDTKNVSYFVVKVLK